MLELSANALEMESRPEHELLLWCARNYIEADASEKVDRRIEAFLEKDIDWVYLLQTATWHKVMPLLYWSLNSVYPEAIPKNILVTLRDYFYANAQRNLFQTQELLKLLNLLQSNEIRAIPYKGVTLTLSVYGNLALRHIGDLDILVREQDFLKAKNLLLSQGYQSDLNLPWANHFINAEQTIGVDLHQAIAPKYFCFPLDFEKLWSRLELASLANTKVPTLQPEDLLLILCLEWSKDCGYGKQRLVQLCDVAKMLRVHSQLNLLEISRLVRFQGCERMLLLNLFLAHELLGVALPEEVLNSLRIDRPVKLLAAQVRSRFWCQPNELPIVSEEKIWSLFFSYPNRFQIKMRERLQDKFMYCIHKIHDAIERDVVVTTSKGNT